MTVSTLNSYDAVPYESLPFAQSHPARMSGMAKLFGLAAPPLATARVLELGCSFGGNLLPLAMRYPDARFVGADLSQVQISQANQIKDELGARNVTFRQADILDMAKESEQYDYIIAHGVYSWVPPEVQDALLELYGRQLAPEGVGYVSYNVYPGWKMREVVREMMLFHVGNLTDNKAKLAQARAILQYAGKLHANNQSAFGRLMAEEARVLMQFSDSYIFHEHLEPNNRPCYFHQFVAAAARHGLTYLGESDLALMLPDRHGADLANTARNLSGGNILASEQYVDLLANRVFRQTLLVPAGRAPAIKRALTADSFRNLHISTQLKAAPAVQAAKSPQAVAHGTYVDGTNHQITANQPLAKALLDRLVAASPYAVPFEELIKDLAAFAQAHAIPIDATNYVLSQLQVLLGQGVVTLYGEPMPRPSSDTAQVSAYARWHAARGNLVTNALHDLVQLTPEQGSVVKGAATADAARVSELINLGVMV
jgi:SAM-dependent methyltransferase/methyltransferase-like protein